MCLLRQSGECIMAKVSASCSNMIERVRDVGSGD